MTDEHRSAVVYAAKSTEDRHGSIGTQTEDCRTMAERNGWDVVGEFADEAFSAFSGNRGPDLKRAKALAVATAKEHGACILIAQDADRFARGAGDEPGAADHLGEVYFEMKRSRVELWTVRSGQLAGGGQDPLPASPGGGISAGAAKPPLSCSQMSSPVTGNTRRPAHCSERSIMYRTDRLVRGKLQHADPGPP